MNRRNLLSSAALLLGVLPRHMDATLESDQPLWRGDLHPDYWIGWTGWKACKENNWLCSQWLAFPKNTSDPVRYFASTPGSEGWFIQGDIFDIARRDNQVLVLSPKEPRAEAAKRECFYRLMGQLRKQERPDHLRDKLHG
jgi:hypothetical protein